MDLNSFDYLNDENNGFLDLLSSLMSTEVVDHNLATPTTIAALACNAQPMVNASSTRRETFVYNWQVEVKTSAHVSYIVGKQGRKIRELRQRTHTNIITPVNGDAAIFEISGPVYRNVLAAGEHIRMEEARFDKEMQEEARAASNEHYFCLNFFLPQSMIGLVVGRAGKTIKKIMLATETEIETPKVNTINRFKIGGTKENVCKAVDLIAALIKSNTGLTFTRSYENHSLTFEFKSFDACEQQQ